MRVKLAGKVEANSTTGQLVSTFEQTPQLPFEEFQLKFFGGDKAALATTVGTYRTDSSIEPWSGTPAAQPFSQFNVTTGPKARPPGVRASRSRRRSWPGRPTTWPAPSARSR